MDKSGYLMPIRTLSAGLLCTLVVTLCVCDAAQARAPGQSSDLAAKVSQLNSAEGPAAFTAVRQIWGLWGTEEPTRLEQALVSISGSPRMPPAVRAYAGFLAAHARTRRGDVAGATRGIEQLGYVKDWLVLGPFDNEGKAGFDVDYGPETQFAEPIVEGRAYTGKERAVRWRPVPDAFPFGWVDGSALFRPEQNVCFYATTFVENPAQTPKAVTVWAGASGAMRLHVNGLLVLEDRAYRGHDADRLGAKIELPAGTSNLTLKVCGTDSAPVVSLRVADAEGLAGAQLRSSATPFASQAARTNFERLKIVTQGLGPIARFDAATKGKKATAATLEQYARYLVETQGDDPTVHQARDLAARAADEDPSIERQLLAGRLSEDYNSHRLWVERAEALAKQEQVQSVELLLARATVERGGMNWRDAFPYFEQALAIDPDNVDALQGRVELYNEAGLVRTALALLRAAADRNPTSVTLLNMLASQLRQVGQVLEAEEIERRYAQYRFDDHTYLGARLDLALARGEHRAAAHWAERMISVNPSSLWVRGVVARAYRRMKQPERAISSYQYALNLAPEDTGILRALSDLHGELGNRAEQLRLLRKIVEIRPQTKEVTEYLSQIEPEAAKPDEAYAWAPDEFLKKRSAPSMGESRRTLLNLSVRTVFENGLSSEFRQVVFQPLVDSAAALSRQYAFQYQADSQAVQLRGARVFRTDGRIDEAIETGVAAANDPSVAMYTSARTYYVQFPRLEAGDVVELQYRIDDSGGRNEFADYFGATEQLQSSETVSHAEFVLITPKRRKFYIDQQNIPGLKTEVVRKPEQTIYRFWAANLAGINPEPAMPPWSEVLGFIHVSTYPSYAELGQWYWGLAQDQFDLDDETRKLANQLVKGLSTDREKVAAIYNWVIQNTRYVALEFGIYGFKPRRCVQTVNRGWGDCKDKATVIVSLLKAVGIPSTIVIIRTQMRGRFSSSVASLAPFDHAIAYVPSLDLYLDGTAEFTGSTELPAMDQESTAILVNEGKPTLVTVPLADPEHSVLNRRTVAHLARDGSAELKLEYLTSGIHAPSWRSRYSSSGTRRERLSKDLAGEFPGLRLGAAPADVNVEVADFEKPVRVSLKATAPSFARPEGDRWTFAATSRTRLTEAFASLSQRQLAVAVPAFGSREEVVEVHLPKGMTLKNAPIDVERKSPFGDFSVQVQHAPGKVTVTSRLLLKKTRIPTTEYAAWRAFCESVDAAFTPRVVVGE
ncbi:MAG: hypothetical protein RJA70_2448 [Pseudomonadota bacterium]|jgi:tetratricopeptide (TPR) repeat protein